MRDDSLARRVAGAAMGAAAMASLALAAPAVAQERQYELVSPPGSDGYHVKLRAADSDLNRIYYEVGSTASPPIARPDGGVPDHFAATRTAQGWETSWLTPYCLGSLSVHDPEAACGGPELGARFVSARDGKVTFVSPDGILGTKPEVIPGPTTVVIDDVYSGDAQTTSLLSWETPPGPGGWGAGVNNERWVVASADQATVAFTSSDIRRPEAAGLPAGDHLYVRRGASLRLASAPVGGASGGECTGACEVHTLSMGGNTGKYQSPSVTHVVSDDGQRVFFRTDRRLHPDATPGRDEVYVLDGDQLRLLSGGLVNAAGAGAASSFEWAAADGSRAFIVTGSIGNNVLQSSGRISVVDVPSGAATSITPDGAVGSLVWASDDGSAALLTSQTQFADAPPDAPALKLYVWRQGTGVRYVGPWANGDTLGAPDPVLRDVRGTPDGSTIVFRTRAALDPADTNGVADLYRLRGTTVTWLTPRSGAGASADVFMTFNNFMAGFGVNFDVAAPRALTADAETVFFNTTSSLVAEDTDGGKRDVYSVRDGQYTLITPAGDAPFDHWLNDNSADGSVVLFSTEQSVTEVDTDEGMVDVYAARTSGAFVDRLPESSTGAPSAPSGPGGAAPVPSAPSAGSSGSASSEDPVPVVPEWPADPGQQSGSSSAGELGLEDGPVFGARRALVPLVVPGRGRARVVLKGRVGKRTRTLARGSRSFARGGERSVRLRLTRHGRRFDGRRVTVRVVFVGADGERQRLRERTGLGDA